MNLSKQLFLYDKETNQGLNVEVLEKENAEEYLRDTYNIQDVKKVHKKEMPVYTRC